MFRAAFLILLCLTARSLTAAADGPTALARLREHLVEIGYPDAATVALTIDPDYRGSFKIMVGKTLPPGWWGVHQQAVVYANQSDGMPRRSFYRLDAPGTDLPDPQSIHAGLCQPGTETAASRASAGKAIELMHRWFDVHRNDEAYGINLSYDRLAQAYAAAGRERDLPAVLEKELAAATGPKAEYEILHHQAICLRDAGNLAQAEAVWREASALMAAVPPPRDAWHDTRVASPLLEIAHMYAAKDPAKALAAYADYFATPSARESSESRPVLDYGELLLGRGRAAEAVTLCETYLAVQAERVWGGEQLKEKVMGQVRELLAKAKGKAGR